MKNNDNTWENFISVLDTKYLFLKKKNLIKKLYLKLGILFILIVLLLAINIKIDNNYKHIWEMYIVAHWNFWKESGMPSGADLTKLTEEKKWMNDIIISNYVFNVEGTEINTLFAYPYMKTGKVLFIACDGTLLWVSPKGKIRKVRSNASSFSTTTSNESK